MPALANHLDSIHDLKRVLGGRIVLLITMNSSNDALASTKLA
jgi:hypothetical protein